VTGALTVASQGRFTVRKKESRASEGKAAGTSNTSGSGGAPSSSHVTGTNPTIEARTENVGSGGSGRSSSRSGRGSRSSGRNSSRTNNPVRVGGNTNRENTRVDRGESVAPKSEATRSREYLEKRRERVVIKHQEEASNYMKDATSVNTDRELINKLRYMPVAERRSYRAVSTAVSRINNSNQGVYDYKQIESSINKFREESKKDYKHIKTITEELQYDIDEFETNWAVETINNHDKIEGSKEEKQEVLDHAIRVVKSNKDKGGVFKEIISKSLADVNTLEEGKIPIRRKAPPSTHEIPTDILSEANFSDSVDTPEVDIDLQIAMLKYNARRETAMGILSTLGSAGLGFTMAAGGASSGSAKNMVNMGLAGIGQGKKLENPLKWISDKLPNTNKEYEAEKERLHAEAEENYTYEANKFIRQAREAGQRAGEESMKERLEKRQKLSEELRENGRVVLVDKNGKFAVRKKEDKK
jgi:hypothetical protein